MCFLRNMCHINALHGLPFYYLAQTETGTEDNILSASPETFGNNTFIDENIDTTKEGKIVL